MFKTLQGRLRWNYNRWDPNHGRSESIFKSSFLPEFNHLHKVKPEEEGSAFVPWTSHLLSLEEILCIEEEREVNKDNTISYKGKKYQIPESEYRYSFANTTVKVREYKNGKMSIFPWSPKISDVC